MKFKKRTCGLEECKVSFTPHRYDQKYCCKYHGNIQNSRNWRKTRILNPRNKEGILGVKDNQRRDNAHFWKRYMLKNPTYFEDIFQMEMTENNLNIVNENLHTRNLYEKRAY